MGLFSSNKVSLDEISNFKDLEVYLKNNFPENATELISRINQVKTGADIRVITRDGGLRDKVKLLLQGIFFNFPAEKIVYKKLLEGQSSFIQMIPQRDNLSGWKIHLYGECTQHTFKLYQILHSFLESNCVPYKLSTQKFFEKTKNTPQKGKALTLYIPDKIIVNIKQFLEILNNLLINAEPIPYVVFGNIRGDKRLFGSINYRYDLSIPYVKGGFDNDTIYKYYRKNDGNYNIDGNPDIMANIYS